MSKHSPEPWVVAHGYQINDAEGVQVMCAPEPDAERIVACVNALAGLEPGLVKELVEVAWKHWRVCDDGPVDCEVCKVLAKIKQEAK